ncbi:hypothetical protein IE53DRAFT_377497 [Violaceomyces palustris]|uniref:Uncharacterized protein n=1 Tax=Violaceomyces palustris TaxID=1673888 RepID=A0ACD0P527_9BASI|nr:hypothetical protein IE53DRAFT_377497 [Violaceomyces palustris]
MGGDFKRKRQSNKSGRGGGGGGGAKGGRSDNNKRTRYNGTYRIPSKKISGPGIFLTVTKGKERRAAAQFIDYLDDVADQIYPGLDLLDSDDEGEGQEDEAVGGEKVDWDDEDALDRLMNGSPTLPDGKVDGRDGDRKGEVDGPQVVEEQGGEEQTDPPSKKTTRRVEEDDVEAMIRAELEELKGNSGGVGHRRDRKLTKEEGKSEDQSSREKDGKKPRQKRRFVSVETDTECLCFIKCARPIDPFKMVYHILEEIERTGEARTMYVYRISPVKDTCPAYEDSLKELTERTLEQDLPKDESKTFKIEPRIRSHSNLKRDQVIQIVVSSLPQVEGGKHKVDLKNPQLLIVVEIFKSIAAVGVVREYERFKRFNLQLLASDAKSRLTGQNQESEGSGDQGKIGGGADHLIGRVKASAESSR